MKLVIVVILLSFLGCATTGGRVGVGVAGVAAGAVVVNSVRALGCDDEDSGCRDDVRTAGFVLAGVSVAALITAIVFEVRAGSRTRSY